MVGVTSNLVRGPLPTDQPKLNDSSWWLAAYSFQTIVVRGQINFEAFLKTHLKITRQAL